MQSKQTDETAVVTVRFLRDDTPFKQGQEAVLPIGEAKKFERQGVVEINVTAKRKTEQESE